jgi:hypothetical protein
VTAKKRRRRRSAPRGRNRPRSRRTDATEVDEETLEDGEVVDYPPVPGILSALRAGVVAVTTTPLLLAIPFLFVFLLWTILVLLGLQVPPSGLVDAMGSRRSARSSTSASHRRSSATHRRRCSSRS